MIKVGFNHSGLQFTTNQQVHRFKSFVFKVSVTLNRGYSGHSSSRLTTGSQVRNVLLSGIVTLKCVYKSPGTSSQLVSEVQ